MKDYTGILPSLLSMTRVLAVLGTLKRMSDEGRRGRGRVRTIKLLYQTCIKEVPMNHEVRHTIATWHIEDVFDGIWYLRG